MRRCDRFVATALVMLALVVGLGSCGPRKTPAPAPSVAGEQSSATAKTPEPSPSAPAPSPAIFPSPAPAASPEPSPSAPVPSASPAQFNLGLPAGDCYNPLDLVADADRGMAYVYCGSSPARRPLISVVDLASGQVARTIPLAGMQSGGRARLLLPIGDRLLLIDADEETLTVVDTATGALAPAIPGFRDGVLSEDGRLLYALGASELFACPVDGLLAGSGEPLWSVPERFVHIAANGAGVLAAPAGPGGRVVAFDAATGAQVASAELPDLADGLAPGPDGGWAVRVGGAEPAVLRFDASLRQVAQAPAPGGYDITYDAARERYLLAGYDPQRDYRNFLVALGAADLVQQVEFEWPGYNPPGIFAPIGPDRLAGIAASGEARLVVLDAATLAPAGRIALGIWLTDMALDEAAGLLYVADNQERIHVLDAASGRSSATWAGAAPIDLDSANRRLYINSPEGVQALDLSTGQPVASFGRRGVPAADPSRDLVYIVSDGITLHDRSGREIGRWNSSFRDPQGFSPNPSAIAGRVNPVTGYLAAVFDNGVPGSNGATYLQLYPPAEEQPIRVPGTFSFVVDLAFGPAGETFVSYSPYKNLEGIQRLGADGRELGRLLGRTGLLALDAENRGLYAVYEDAVTRLDSETLTLKAFYDGPSGVRQIAYDRGARRLYLRSEASPIISVLALDDLRPLDQRPQPDASIPTDASCLALAVVPAEAGQRVYAVFSDALYRSADGVAWERLPVGSQPAFGQLAAAQGGALFFTAIGGSGSSGVWRSTDGGDSWQLLVEGLADLRASQGVLARGPDEAYFVSNSEGLMRWEPGSARWRRIGSGEPGQGEHGTYLLAPDGTLFEAGWQMLQRSTDRGATWQALRPPSDWGTLLGFSATYTETRTIFALYGDQGTTAMRSTDAGETWAPMELGMDTSPYAWPPQLAAGPGGAYLLLPAAYQGPPAVLLRTTDDGASWQSTRPGAVNGAERVAVGPDGRLWLASRGAIRWAWAKDLPWVAAGSRAAATVRPPASPAPSPALSPAPAPTPCALGLGADDDELARRIPALGCPREGPAQIAMARQPFERGSMIWRADRRVIYVLYPDGRWQAFDDTWAESMPESDASITPPAGLVQPLRGFGLVWRTKLGGPGAAIGWATEPEQGLAGSVLAWDGGEVLRLADTTYALLASGQWR